MNRQCTPLVLALACGLGVCNLSAYVGVDSVGTLPALSGDDPFWGVTFNVHSHIVDRYAVQRRVIDGNAGDFCSGIRANGLLSIARATRRARCDGHRGFVTALKPTSRSFVTATVLDAHPDLRRVVPYSSTYHAAAPPLSAFFDMAGRRGYPGWTCLQRLNHSL